MPQLHRGDILLDRALLSDWPLPADDDDKFARGTVLVVAGSAETPGAALLAALATLRMGGGRLQIATAAETATAIA
ncbi:MAG: NAD(P)H-hydrate dehydratase, partial [Acidimicrobiia bacterium]